MSVAFLDLRTGQTVSVPLDQNQKPVLLFGEARWHAHPRKNKYQLADELRQPLDARKLYSGRPGSLYFLLQADAIEEGNRARYASLLLGRCYLVADAMALAGFLLPAKPGQSKARLPLDYSSHDDEDPYMVFVKTRTISEMEYLCGTLVQETRGSHGYTLTAEHRAAFSHFFRDDVYIADKEEKARGDALDCSGNLAVPKYGGTLLAAGTRLVPGNEPGTLLKSVPVVRYRLREDPSIQGRRDPVNNSGIVDRYYVCCGQPLDHPGCLIDTYSAKTADSQPYVVGAGFNGYDLLAQGRTADQIVSAWNQSYQRGTAYLDLAYYDRLHERIRTFMGLVGFDLVSAFRFLADPLIAIKAKTAWFTKVSIVSLNRLVALYTAVHQYNYYRCREASDPLPRGPFEWILYLERNLFKPEQNLPGFQSVANKTWLRPVYEQMSLASKQVTFNRETVALLGGVPLASIPVPAPVPEEERPEEPVPPAPEVAPKPEVAPTPEVAPKPEVAPIPEDETEVVPEEKPAPGLLDLKDDNTRPLMEDGKIQPVARRYLEECRERFNSLADKSSAIGETSWSPEGRFNFDELNKTCVYPLMRVLSGATVGDLESPFPPSPVKISKEALSGFTDAQYKMLVRGIGYTTEAKLGAASDSRPFIQVRWIQGEATTRGDMYLVTQWDGYPDKQEYPKPRANASQAEKDAYTKRVLGTLLIPYDPVDKTDNETIIKNAGRFWANMLKIFLEITKPEYAALKTTKELWERIRKTPAETAFLNINEALKPGAGGGRTRLRFSTSRTSPPKDIAVIEAQISAELMRLIDPIDARQGEPMGRATLKNIAATLADIDNKQFYMMFGEKGTIKDIYLGRVNANLLRPILGVYNSLGGVNAFTGIPNDDLKRIGVLMDVEQDDGSMVTVPSYGLSDSITAGPNAHIGYLSVPERIAVLKAWGQFADVLADIKYPPVQSVEGQMLDEISSWGGSVDD